MATRTVNISLSEQTPQIRTLRFIPRLASVDGDVLLRRPFVVETDEDGDATVDLPVKASGSLRYDYEIDGYDGVSAGHFFLSAGSAIDLDDLIVAGGVATDSVIEYVDAEMAEHATVKASTTVLGHVKVDGDSITIDGDGVISVADLVEMTVEEVSALPAAVDVVDDDILLISQDIVRVSGAGSADLNGDYTLRGQLNGKNFYNLIGQATNAFRASVYASTDHWFIYGSTAFTAHYRSTSLPQTPDLVSTWVNTGGGLVGVLPLPTVTLFRALFRVPRSVLLAGLGVWGNITGDLATQTDLVGALEAKLGSDYGGTFDMINNDGTQFRSNSDGAFVGKADAHIDASSGVLRLVGSTVELNGLPVTIGDNDSGGSGFRALVVANS